MSYHNQTHFCTTLKIWRKIDYGNCIVLSGPDRNAVDRYKEEFGNEHKVEILLFRSKSDLNQNEKSNAEKWKAEIKAAKYFEENKARFKEMTHEASIEYLKNQNFGSEMLRRCVEVKVSNFILHGHTS